MATYTSGARARTANRAVHHVLGSRAFGATGGRLELSGRPLRRTTSSWWNGPSTLLDGSAPCARLVAPGGLGRSYAPQSAA